MELKRGEMRDHVVCETWRDIGHVELLGVRLYDTARLEPATSEYHKYTGVQLIAH